MIFLQDTKTGRYWYVKVNFYFIFEYWKKKHKKRESIIFSTKFYTYTNE